MLRSLGALARGLGYRARGTVVSGTLLASPRPAHRLGLDAAGQVLLPALPRSPQHRRLALGGGTHALPCSIQGMGLAQLLMTLAGPGVDLGPVAATV